MTAIMTGEKTLAGVIAIDKTARRNDCKSARGHGLHTLLEQAEQAGRSTGIVTTTRLTHATPAAIEATATPALPASLARLASGCCSAEM